MAGIKIPIDVSGALSNLDKLTKELNTLSTVTKVSVAAIDKLTGTIEKNGNKSKKTISDFEKFQKTIKQAGLSTKLTDSAIKDLYNRFATNKAVNQATKAQQSLISSLKLSEKEIKKLGLEVTKTNKDFIQLAGASNFAANQIKAAFAGLTTYFTFTYLKDFTVDIINTGAEYQKTMAAIGGITRQVIDGQATPSLKALEEQILHLGETTEYTSNQVAEATRYIVQTGFTAEQAYGALQGVLDLATAGQLDLARAADIATNALKVFRIDEEKLTTVNDAFVATITRSNTNVDQLGEALKFSGPAARAFGGELEETVALLGKLGDAGLQGSLAGTQLGQAYQRAGDVFAKFFEQMPKESTYGPIIDALDLIEKKQLSTIETYELFTERAGRAFAILQTVGAKDLKKFIDTVRESEGESKRLAETMRNTVVGAFKELQSVIESVKIKAFLSEAGPLKESIKSLTTAIRDNREGLEAFAALLVKTAEAAIILAANLRKIPNILPFGDLIFADEANASKVEKFISNTSDQIDKLQDKVISFQNEASKVLMSDDAEIAAKGYRNIADIDKDILETEKQISALRDKQSTALTTGKIPDTAEEIQNRINDLNKVIDKTIEVDKELEKLAALRKEAASTPLAQYALQSKIIKEDAELEIKLAEEKIKALEELIEKDSEHAKIYKDKLEVQQEIIKYTKNNVKIRDDELKKQLGVTKEVETEEQARQRIYNEEKGYLQLLSDNVDLEAELAKTGQDSAKITEIENALLRKQTQIKIAMLDMDIASGKYTKDQADEIKHFITLLEQQLDLQIKLNNEEQERANILTDIGLDKKDYWAWLKDGLNEIGIDFGDSLSEAMTSDDVLGEIKSAFKDMFDDVADFFGSQVKESVTGTLTDALKYSASFNDLFKGYSGTASGIIGSIGGGLAGGLITSGISAITGLFGGSSGPSAKTVAQNKIETILEDLTDDLYTLSESVIAASKAFEQSDFRTTFEDIVSGSVLAITTLSSKSTGVQSPVDFLSGSDTLLSNLGISGQSALSIAQQLLGFTPEQLYAAGTTGTSRTVGLEGGEGTVINENIFGAVDAAESFRDSLEDFVETFDATEAEFSLKATSLAQSIRSLAVDIKDSVFDMSGAYTNIEDLKDGKDVLIDIMAEFGDSLDPQELEEVTKAIEDVNKALAISKYELELNKRALDASIDSYMNSVLGIDTTVSDAFTSVNQQFIEFAQEMISMGATSEDLAALEEKRLTALKATADYLKTEALSPITDVLEYITQQQYLNAGGTSSGYIMSGIQSSLASGGLSYTDLAGLSEDLSDWFYARVAEEEESLNEWISAQEEAAQLWEQVADIVEQLSDSITEKIRDLTYSSLNPALNVVQAGQAQMEYDQLLALAMTGDQQAIEDFIAFTNTYLKLQQNDLASSEAYQKIFEDTLDDLELLQQMLDSGDFDRKIYNELKTVNDQWNLENFRSMKRTEYLEDLKVEMEDLDERLAAELDKVINPEGEEAVEDPIVSALKKFFDTGGTIYNLLKDSTSDSATAATYSMANNQGITDTWSQANTAATQASTAAAYSVSNSTDLSNIWTQLVGSNNAVVSDTASRSTNVVTTSKQPNQTIIINFTDADGVTRKIVQEIANDAINEYNVELTRRGTASVRRR